MIQCNIDYLLSQSLLHFLFLANHYFTLCVKFMDNLFKQNKEVILIRKLDNTLYFV